MNKMFRFVTAAFTGLLIFLCCFFLMGASPGEALSFSWWKGDPPSFKEAWDTTVDKLEDALDLLDQHDSLPDKKMMHHDKAENDEEIEEILEDLVLFLSDTRTARLRKEAQKLQAYRADTEAEIAALEEKMLTAPEEGSLLTKSREDLKEKIAKLQGEVAETDRVLGECRQAIVASLQESGISVSEEDVRGILVSVTGEDILGMYGVYQNVRAFSNAMGELLSKESGSPSIAKRYYGIYALLIRTCMVMNDRFVEKIDQRYLPVLGDLEKQAVKLRNEAKDQLRRGGLSQLLPQIALVPLAEYLILQGFLRSPLLLALGATGLGLGGALLLKMRGGQPGEKSSPILLRHAARTAWKNPPLRGIILSYAIYALMTAPVMPFIANAAKEWGTAGSFFLFPCALAAVLSRALLARLVDRRGAQLLLPAFTTLFGGALCALWGKSTFFFLLGGSCSGIGMGLVQPMLQSLLTQHTPEHLRPSQFALFGAAMDLIWLGTPFVISGGAALLGYGGILRITATLAFTTLPLLYFVLWPPLQEKTPSSEN